MIRRSFHPLVVTSLAALTLAGCSDDVTPTAVTPTAEPPRRASSTLFVASDATYPILHGTIRIYDTEFKSINGAPLSPLGSVGPAGAIIRVTGKWQIGPITNVAECQLCSYSVYLAWSASTGAAPINQGLVTLISSQLNPEPGDSGTFDWTTRAPYAYGDHTIKVGQSLGSTFDNTVGASRTGVPTTGPSYDVSSFIYSVLGPTIAPVVTGMLGDNGWYKSDVTVSWEITERDSFKATEKSGCDPVTVTSDVADMTLTCSVTSAKGVAVRPVTINRDTGKPTIAFNSATPAANAAGWNKSDVTATWTCSDVISGVTSASVSQTISAEGANQSATGNCVDKAGNTAIDARTGIKLDKTPPVLFPSVSPSPVALNSTATALPNASDALSGLAEPASCGAVVTNLAGTFTIGCRATDKAGNTATQRLTYTVNGYTFGGFLSPVSAPPTLNAKTAGSAVPVNFSLGGNQGLAILAAGSPTSKAITCPAGATVTTIDETTTSTSGNSVLTYDATTDQYRYTWKTEKSWAGTCRMLVVKLADGLEYSANFQFKK